MKWIRTERALPLPAWVRQVLGRLQKEGHSAYIVGGSVRNLLLGLPTQDHDIATSARPEQVSALFESCVMVGSQFGVVKVMDPSDPASGVEVATFRSESDYRDSRHPSRVEFSSIEEDAYRRDFTINGLYYDYKSIQILDLAGGMADLKAKIIRAIGDPRERFREDALRLLRAIRFSCQLGFEIELQTWEAIQARVRLIQKVSGERIRDELGKVFAGPNPVRGFELLQSSGLFVEIFPEIANIKNHATIYPRLLRILGALKAAGVVEPSAYWAGFFHEWGKLLTTQQYEKTSCEIASKVMSRLHFPNAVKERVLQAILCQPKFKEIYGMREATLLRFVSQEHFEDALQVQRAESLASDGNVAFYEFGKQVWLANSELLKFGVPKWITGEDLIQLGLEPGPYFAEILRSVEDLVLERRIASRDQAFEYVLKHYVK